MALYFSESFLREVMDRNDIESVISRYVQLKRTGSSLKGLCPFHKEKTPLSAFRRTSSFIIVLAAEKAER